MPGFADEYHRQRAQQTQTDSSRSAAHEDVSSLARTTTAKPSDAVLTKWRSDVCAGPDAPLVCDTSLSRTLDPTRPAPVPAPFNIPVPGPHCVAPPPPHDWAQVPSLASCPSEMIASGPSYNPEYQSENLEPYKVAFSSSWADASTSYNALVTLHRAYKDKERYVIPLLQLDASRAVGAGVQGIDASKSFDGAKLKPSLTKVDSSTLSPELRAQVFKAQDKIKLTDLDIASKRDLVSNANASLLQAANSVEMAANNIGIVEADTKIENLQLDKDEVRRDLEDFKAKVKATIESVKFVTSIINCWSDPTKLFGNAVGAVNQGATAGGAIAEAAYTVNANSKLAELDAKIRRLKNYKGGLLAANANSALESALLDVEKRVNEYKIAVRTMESSKLAHADAHRDLGALMEKAGAASGLNPKDRKAVAGAVEAVPKIEMIQQQLQSIDEGLQPPPYNEASGVGAAMASNVGVFTHALSILKGNREYVAELKALWEGRRASVLAVVERAVTVKGTE